MEHASKIMYKIANVFNWIEFACGIILVLCGILMTAGVINSSNANLTGDAAALAAAPGVMIGLGIYVIIITIVIIILTRKAYEKGSSKGWDIAFMVIGICSDNLFYFLGGLFGLIARN